MLHGEKRGELYLRLPRDWDDAILAMKEGFDFKSVLEEMSELGQVRIPKDAQMVRSWKPFLEGVWSLAGNREIHCFMDPCHSRSIDRSHWTWPRSPSRPSSDSWISGAGGSCSRKRHISP